MTWILPIIKVKSIHIYINRTLLQGALSPQSNQSISRAASAAKVQPRVTLTYTHTNSRFFVPLLCCCSFSNERCRLFFDAHYYCAVYNTIWDVSRISTTFERATWHTRFILGMLFQFVRLIGLYMNDCNLKSVTFIYLFFLLILWSTRSGFYQNIYARLPFTHWCLHIYVCKCLDMQHINVNRV